MKLICVLEMVVTVLANVVLAGENAGIPDLGRQPTSRRQLQTTLASDTSEQRHPRPPLVHVQHKRPQRPSATETLDKRRQRPPSKGKKPQGLTAATTTPASDDRPEIIVAIINGTPVPADGLYPWMASLQFWDGWVEDYIHVCGAVIIEPRYLLTAAHCVDSNAGEGRDNPAMYQVRAGSIQLYAPDSNAQISRVTSLTQNSGWGQNGQESDLAIITLTTALTMTSTVGVVELPSATNSYSGAACSILGWGMTKPPSDGGSDTTNLQVGSTYVMSNSDCQAQLPLAVTVNQVCTPGGAAPSICLGDSGGPMVVQRADRLYEVVGVSSYSYNQCSGYPSVYTRVSQYLSWIGQSTP